MEQQKIAYLNSNINVFNPTTGAIIPLQYEHISMFPRDFKLMLRPMANIYKQITTSEGIFKPIDVLVEMLEKVPEIKYNRAWIEYIVENPLHLPYFLVEKLIKWGFDVFRLIEKGEAVEVSSI